MVRLILRIGLAAGACLAAPSLSAGTPEPAELMRTLQDTTLGAYARKQALVGLSQLPAAQTRPLFRPLLDQYAGERDLEVLGALGAFFSRIACPHLDLMLAVLDEENGPHGQILDSLSSCPDLTPAAYLALRRFVSHKDPGLARGARLTLERKGHRAPVALLGGWLKDGSPELVLIAAQALAFQGKPAVSQAPRLLEAAAAGPANVRQMAFHALREINGGAAVVAGLKHQNPSVRAAAAEFCGRWGWWWDPAPKGLLQALTAGLADPDAAVRGHAEDALALFGPAARDASIGLLKSTDPSLRLAACRLLGRQTRRKPNAAKSVAAALRDADPAVRRAGAQALEALGPDLPDEAAAALGPGLADPDATVRLAAAAALGSLKSGLVQPHRTELEKALLDGDPKVREQAALALGGALEMGALTDSLKALAPGPALFLAWGRAQKAPESVLAEAQASLGSQEQDLRLSALYCLARCDPDRLFRSPPPASPGLPEARLWLYAAGRAGDSPALRTWLGRALAMPAPELSQAAARALASLGEIAPDASGALAARLADKDVCTAWQAADSLGRLVRNTARALPELAAALADERSCGQRLVSEAAAGALEQAGPAALPELLQALQAPQAGARRRAARLLGRLGPRAGKGGRPLAALVSDSDASVAEEAALALGKLDQKDAEIWDALLKGLFHPSNRHQRGIGVSGASFESLLRLRPPAAVVERLFAGPEPIGEELALLLCGLDGGLASRMAEPLAQIVRRDPKRAPELRSVLHGSSPSAEAFAQFLDQSGPAQGLAIQVLAQSDNGFDSAFERLNQAKDWTALADLVSTGAGRARTKAAAVLALAPNFNDGVLHSMAGALALASPDEGVLRAALGSEQPSVRRLAVMTAARLGVPAGLAYTRDFAALARDKDLKVGLSAIDALGGQGRDARSSLPLLQDLAGASQSRRSHAAGIALQRIAP